MISSVNQQNATGADKPPSSTLPARVAVAANDPQRQEEAAALAARLGLPFLGVATTTRQPPGTTGGQLSGVELLLWLSSQRLALQPLTPGSGGPLYVDLLGGAVGYRRRHGGGRQQALARAVGLKQGKCPTVFDATAGLGRDGFILAELGCRVVLCERSPLIHALLADGLKRALDDPASAAVINQRLTLLAADATTYLNALPHPAAEVIYLDPMFPERKKSALVKKEMRLLRLVAGEDDDAAALLQAALAKAGKRVVVKRPAPAPPLPGPPPSFSQTGKSNRFDIYLIP